MVDRYSNTYISYSAKSKLKLAKKINGAWYHEIIDPAGTTTYTHLSMDAQGLLHVTYCDQETSLKYAHEIKAA